MNKLILVITLSLISELKSEDENETKIVGGDLIEISAVPYQASLAHDGKFMCGASIISTKFLLTAAHCTHGMDNKFTVRVGSNTAESGGDVIAVEKVINHPRFSLVTLNYDFALLKLKNEIILKPGVKEIIELPAMNDKISADTEVFVSGFGLTDENAFSTDSRLRGVVVPVVDMRTCRRSYPFLVTEQMICAGYSSGGKDSCSGDSGGPMRRLNDNKLIGVVSFGKGCALPKLYGVYSKISSVRKWINSQSGV